MRSDRCRVIVPEHVEIAEDDTKAVQQFDGCSGRDSLSVHECARIGHGFDHDDPVSIVEDAVFWENIGARKLNVSCHVVHTASSCCSRLQLVDEALLLDDVSGRAYL